MFQISISPEEIGRLELASFPGEIHVIDALGDEFGKAVNYLNHQKGAVAVSARRAAARRTKDFFISV